MTGSPAQGQPFLLDGGMGRELRFRGVEILDTIWSAYALIVAPDAVREIHRDYIGAGAEIITTNTYGVIRGELAKEGWEDRFAELNLLACDLANEARAQSGEASANVRIAGSLPPLRGSYRPDLVGPFAEIYPLYQEQASLLAPHVDLLLCETMSSGAEALAATKAASETGKPVWVSFTLHENYSGLLRSGETVAEAVAMLDGFPISGILANCSAPESITAAMPDLIATGAEVVGGYANTFLPVPETWTLDGDRDWDGVIGVRDDLDPKPYGDFASQWLELGANAIGGCCGTRPAHIARLREIIAERVSGIVVPTPANSATP